jgi:hypothetical protein
VEAVSMNCSIALAEIGDFIVHYLNELEAMFEKVFTRVLGPRGSCLLKKKQEIENLMLVSEVSLSKISY